MPDFNLVALNTALPRLRAIPAGDRGVIPGSLLVEETLEVTLGIVGFEIGVDIQAHSVVLDATTASFLLADGTKLDAIEPLADVTDTASVTAAGALMDSEIDADIKTLILPADTTISVFGASIIDDADEATFKATVNLEIGTDIQAHSVVLDATTASFLLADETKLDAIEPLADVTDTANVAAAGAVIVGGDGGTPSALVLTNATELPFSGLADGIDGELITWDADGVIAAIGVGAADEVLTSNGVGAAPTFQAAAGGGAFNTFGTENLFAGTTAGDSLTTGTNNFFAGLNAGTAVTDGTFNVAIGSEALSVAVTPDNTIAIGNSAMKSGLTTGSNNIAIGQFAGNVITSGSDNVYVGRLAGLVNTTGSNQIMIGETLSASGTAVADEYIIGHDITGAGTETTKIGSSTDSIVNDWGENATWTHSSDMRMKNIIGSSPLGLNFINNLNPVEFTKKPASQLPEEWGVDKDAKIDTDKIYQGMVAQEVRTALDLSGVGNFGGWREDADGRQRIGDAAFVFPLINAVKELTEMNKLLMERLDVLEGAN